MALHSGQPGARRPRQGLERLAIPIRVQRGTITIGEAPYLLDGALSNSHQRPASDALALQFVHRPPEFISILQRRISKSIAKDRWLRKSDPYPALAKPRYYDRPSVARPVILEANPNGVRPDTLLQRQHRH